MNVCASDSTKKLSEALFASGPLDRSVPSNCVCAGNLGCENMLLGQSWVRKYA